jgi:hypothetical protein
MPQFLVAVQHPDTFDSSQESPETIRDIHALNEEMAAAGVRFFAGGLESPRHAKSLRKEPNGNTAVTDGPFLEAKEYVGGFWILNCANMDDAVKWGKKACAACRTPVEVRAFLEMPSE